MKIFRDKIISITENGIGVASALGHGEGLLEQAAGRLLQA